MLGKITISGLVQSVSESTFEDVKSYTYQFLTKNKNGKLSVLDVKSKGVDLGLSQDEEASIEVSVSCYDNKIYFNALGLSKK